MLGALVRFSLQFRGVIVALAAMALLFGGYTLTRAQYDIFPEFLPPQVTVQTEAPGFSPEQVEALVTQAVENALHGVAGVEAMRSSSLQGLSVVRLTFAPGSDAVRSRQAVSERIETLSNSLPQHVKLPVMTPLTTSTSVVYAFGLTSDTVSQMDLRTAADWVVKQRLLAVPGVNRVSVFGGEVREMQVQVMPDKLRFFNLGLPDVLGVAARATGVDGAGFIDTPNQRILLQTQGQALTPERLANTVFIRGADEAGEAIDLNIVLGDIATVTEGPKPPTSMASIMGKKGVLIFVSSQYGSNTLEVSQGVEAAMAELKPVMERSGISMSEPMFRPAGFIETALKNLRFSLGLGAALVVAVLFFFLRSPRSALISAVSIPVSLLGAAAVLHYLGYSLNTMTLGGLAIAIGSVVDDAVIDVENIVRRLRQRRAAQGGRSAFEIIRDATLEVRLPVVFASLAILLIFVPVMTMTGLGGRFFSPLGVAHSVAILASLLTALTLTPALCFMLLRDEKRLSEEPAFVQKLKHGYQKQLQRAGGAPRALIAGAALLAVISAMMIPGLKSEFLPELREGHFILHMFALPGTSLEESIRVGNGVTRELLKLPAIRSVAQHAGRAELDDETLGTHVSEFDVALKNVSGDVMEQTDKAIDTVLESFPGVRFTVDTFLTERVEETISGYMSNVVVNLYGPDLKALDEAAHEVAEAAEHMKDAANVQVQAPLATPELSITLRDKDLHYWGFNGPNVLGAIRTAYEGTVAGHLYEHNRITDLTVILDPKQRKSITQVNELPLRSPAGSYVRIDQLADVELKPGRSAVLHDGGRRVQTITMDVKGRDDARFIEKLKQEIAGKVKLPDGVYVSYTGTAEAEAKSRHDLLAHSAVAAMAIVLLIAVVVRSFNNLLLLLANIPFALVGGVWAVALSGGELSLGALVGFVTLFGISLRNSVMLLSHYDHLVRHEGMGWNAATALKGSSERVLPILMTALVTALGLLPLALGAGEAGREVEGPMALVILGGLVTSTALNLLIMPVLALKYGRFGQARES